MVANLPTRRFNVSGADGLGTSRLLAFADLWIISGSAWMSAPTARRKVVVSLWIPGGASIDSSFVANPFDRAEGARLMTVSASEADMSESSLLSRKFRKLSTG